MIIQQQTAWFVKRARAIGIPNHITDPLIMDFLKWKQCSGEEWAVSRFKAVKLEIVRLNAGLPKVATWVRKNSKGNYYGWVGSILKYSTRSEQYLAKALALINIYTSSISQHITPTQEEKFLNGVCADPIEIPNTLLQDVVQAANAFKSQTHRQKPRPLLTYPAQRLTFFEDQNMKDRNDGVVDSAYFLSNKPGHQFATRFPLLVDPVMEGLIPEWMEALRKPPTDIPSDKLVIGKIGFTQEPGFKLRAFASPGKVFQRILEPLGDALFKRILPKLPWDCTFDQSKPLLKIQMALQNSQTVHSLDLSGATDYFPLSLQISVLTTLLPKLKVSIDAFSEISQGFWKYQDRYIKWTKGQPLGLYPSFAAFAVTHGILLYTLNNCAHNDNFFVLGDDVIILDNDLAQRYRDCMSLLGCPISESKSLSSDSLAEFAGKVITRNSVISAVKWHKISEDNFVEIMKVVGPKGIQFLNARQRKIIKVISDIPVELGGLGWNPEGKPLSVRLQENDWIFEEIQDRGYETSLDPLVIWRLNTSRFTRVRRLETKGGYFHPKDSIIPEDIDQISKLEVGSHLSKRLVPLYRVLGVNLGVVAKNLALPPISFVKNKRLTYLEVLERKIRRSGHL